METQDPTNEESTNIIEPVKPTVTKIKYGDVDRPYIRDTEKLKSVYFSLDNKDNEYVPVNKPVKKKNVYIFVAVIGFLAILIFAIVASVNQRKSANAKNLCNESEFACFV